MRKAVENQVRQRNAVGDAINRQRVFIAATTYGAGHRPLHKVLVSGKYYHADDRTLAELNRGFTPRALGLDAVPEELDG